MVTTVGVRTQERGAWGAGRAGGRVVEVMGGGSGDSVSPAPSKPGALGKPFPRLGPSMVSHPTCLAGWWSDASGRLLSQAPWLLATSWLATQSFCQGQSWSGLPPKVSAGSRFSIHPACRGHLPCLFAEALGRAGPWGISPGALGPTHRPPQTTGLPLQAGRAGPGDTQCGPCRCWTSAWAAEGAELGLGTLCSGEPGGGWENPPGRMALRPLPDRALN